MKEVKLDSLRVNTVKQEEFAWAWFAKLEQIDQNESNFCKDDQNWQHNEQNVDT